MTAPGEHKTVQSRILAYAQEIGWCYVPCAQAEARRGFDPDAVTPEERAPTAGNLNFNAELLALDREIGDYVIVHELLHFSVPNHGKLWKSLMHAHLGDYLQLEKRVRDFSR